MHRRDFVKLGSIIAATAVQSDVYGGEIPQKTTALAGKTVDFINDGVPLSPKEYGELLMKLADEGKIKTDFYSNGGVVEEQELWPTIWH
jgi:threonine aldolase